MSLLAPLERYEFRKLRTRRNIFGTAERPRLSVTRTSKHIYVQLVDDVKGHTLASASSVDVDLRKSMKIGGNLAAAKSVGKLAAERAKKAGIVKVVFDRGGWPFHGRIKAVAEAAREAGLEF